MKRDWIRIEVKQKIAKSSLKGRGYQAGKSVA